MYWYYEIIGDSSSHKHTLTKEALYLIEKEVAKEVCTAYRSQESIPVSVQRKAATLLSISFYCLGGNEPTHMNGRNGFKCPKFAYDQYVFQFTRHIISSFKWCDRDKGAWTTYVRYAKGKACRDTIKWLKEQDKEKELLDTIMNTLAIYCGKNGYSISCKDVELGYSEPESEEIDSKEE